jgi:AraC-like DNA-binding protein
MDPLDDVFAAMRVNSALHCRVEATAPWGVTFVRGKAARFGLVVRGGCWLTAEGQAPIALAAGDCYVIINGGEYTLQDHPGSPAAACYRALREHQNQVVHMGGGGEPATIITGWFLFDRLGVQPLLHLMPPLILTRMDADGSEMLQATLRLLAIETARPELGRSTMVSRLADMLFIQTIRGYAAQKGADAIGWIGALGDAKLARAFSALHERIELPWTVDSLASEAGMSRSAFAARFKEKVGHTPLDYLTQWRMFRAATLLRKHDLSVGAIAARVGYGDESAFAKAFKRFAGMGPGAYRRTIGKPNGGEAGTPPNTVDPRADGMSVVRTPERYLAPN